MSDQAPVERIFFAAKEMSGSERERYLDAECSGRPDVLERVRKLLAADEGANAGGFLQTAAVSASVVARPGDRIDEYQLIERIGEGGFGSVWRAQQEQPLQRTVALKIIKLGMDTEQVMGRFKLERQALALMDHPNIAHAFDAGTTAAGRPYFVMELVSGVPILEHCDSNHLATENRLRLFNQICAAIQHAHQKGIIHRDIKPSNVLVTEVDGEPVVKVIDFGIAKAIDNELAVLTQFTQQQQIVGTPAYMSPEQTGMQGVDVDTRTDVYSLGVLLYELLAGCLPFDLGPMLELGYAEIQRAIREVEPPKPSSRVSSLGQQSTDTAERRSADSKSLTRQLRGDLDWIVMKCLEKDRGRRYASASELAADIGRHLDREPVLAGAPTLSYRVSKFVAKHRFAVSAGLGFLVLLLAGLTTSLSLLKIANTQRVRANRNLQLADTRYVELARLADGKRLSDAIQAADALWPPHAHMVEPLRAWIREQGQPLADALPGHRESLAQLKAKALAYDEAQQRIDRTSHPSAFELAETQEYAEILREDLALLEALEDSEDKRERIAYRQGKLDRLLAPIASLEARVSERRTWQIDGAEDQWRFAVLRDLVRRLESFADPDQGLLSQVRDRLRFAEQLEEQSLTGPQARASWQDAVDDIARLPAYAGLRFEPRIGLLPLGRDPRSGLWEFWHLQSGERPRPGPEGGWEIAAETGLVFVLIHSGSSQMGAQNEDESGEHFDPDAGFNERRIHTVELSAFLCSKYEMTQAQWARFTGRNPSVYTPGMSFGSPPITPVNPVEAISWEDCMDVLPKLGIALPTEAQWEYAARAGTHTPWPTGAARKSLAGFANVRDMTWSKAPSASKRTEHDDWLEDGHAAHAPVGSYRPNGFGLHDVIGNVAEWCLDSYLSPYSHNLVPGTGEHRAPLLPSRVFRGGSFGAMAKLSRSAVRAKHDADHRDQGVGVRPVINLRPVVRKAEPRGPR